MKNGRVGLERTSARATASAAKPNTELGKQLQEVDC